MFMEVPLLAGRGAAYKCSFLRLTLKDSRPAGLGCGSVITPSDRKRRE